MNKINLFNNEDSEIENIIKNGDEVLLKLFISATLSRIDHTIWEKIKIDEKTILTTPVTSKIIDTMKKVEIKKFTFEILKFFVKRLSDKRRKYYNEILRSKIWTFKSECNLARLRFCDCLINSFFISFDWSILSFDDICSFFEEIYVSGFDLVFSFEGEYYTNIKCFNEILSHISRVWNCPNIKVNINPSNEIYSNVYGYCLKDSVEDFPLKIQFIKKMSDFKNYY